MNARSQRLLRTSMSLGTVFLLCLLYVTVPVVVRLTSGTPSYAVGIGLEFFWRAIGLCFYGCLFSIYQRLLYRLLRVRVSHWMPWSAAALLPVVLFGARSVYHSLPSVRAQEILGTAELAPLPESATGITVYTWWTPMSGEEYLRFRASREDIESFVAKSPILERAERRDYSPAKMRLFDRNETAPAAGAGTDDHEYIRNHPTAPPWYMQEIKCRARRYAIPRTVYKHKGELIIDEDNNVVYVRLVFS